MYALNDDIVVPLSECECVHGESMGRTGAWCAVPDVPDVPAVALCIRKRQHTFTNKQSEMNEWHDATPECKIAMCIFRCQKYCAKASRSRRHHFPLVHCPTAAAHFSPTHRKQHIYIHTYVCVCSSQTPCTQHNLANCTTTTSTKCGSMNAARMFRFCMVLVVLVNGFNYSKTVIT